jgi:hypothetical protein
MHGQITRESTRPGGWPSDFPARSLLFGTTPYGFDGATRENIVSFFRRTADSHALLPRSLAYHLLVPLFGIPSPAAADLMADECYRLELCGLSAKPARWVDALNRLTARSDLQKLTLLSFNNLVSSYQLIEPSFRFCPACYAEDERLGRPKYDRLLWTIRCVTACSKHRRRLVMEPTFGKHSPLPFTVPGISRIDGTSLADAISKAASDQEIVVANLVSELIDDVSRIGAERRSSIADLLARAAESIFDGNCAALARYLGVSKSQLHGWMQTENLPSLACAIRVAHAFQCTLAGVLLGRSADPLVRRLRDWPRGLFGLARSFGYKAPRDELVASLSTFIKNNPHACAKEAAIHLGVSPKFLREKFPVQNASLVASARRHRQEQSEAR